MLPTLTDKRPMDLLILNKTSIWFWSIDCLQHGHFTCLKQTGKNKHYRSQWLEVTSFFQIYIHVPRNKGTKTGVEQVEDEYKITVFHFQSFKLWVNHLFKASITNQLNDLKKSNVISCSVTVYLLSILTKAVYLLLLLKQ